MSRFISGTDSAWKKAVRFMGAVAVAAGGLIGVAHAQYVPKKAISLLNGASVTSFDIGWVDLGLGKYFLAERDIGGVVAVNTSTNTIAWENTSLCGLSGCATAGPNGVITVNHNQVWVGDGDGRVKILDPTYGTLEQTIPVGTITPTGRADEGCWDPSHNVVVFAWSDPGDLFIEFIGTGSNAHPYQVLKTITFRSGDQFPDGSSAYATNGIEQCQWDARTNLIYLNIPEINGPGNDSVSGAVAILSGATDDFVGEGHWTVPVADCNGPQGMYIGPRNEIALNCSHNGSTGNGSLILSDQASVNTTSPTIVTTLPTIWGGDEMYYDAGSGQYAFTGSNHKPSAQLAFVAASTDTVDQIFPAAASEHSVAADAAHRQIYFPVVVKAASSKACSAVGGNDSVGCILVLQR